MRSDEDKVFTRFTVEQKDCKYTWEVPFEDINGEDCMEAINMLMIGLTFCQSTVYHAMAEYLMSHAEDMYDIYEKDKTDDIDSNDTD